MKYCHVCKKEFPDEEIFCPVCEEPLLDAPMTDTPLVPEELCGADLKVLMTALDDTEAGIIVGMLGASGIPAMTGSVDEGVFLTAYMGYSAMGMDVIIRACDEEAARAAIEEAQRASENENP